MPGINVLAREAGLVPIKHSECGIVKCKSCGKTVNAAKGVERLFRLILKTVKAGGVVYVKGFGTFKSRVYKGRTLKSPVLEKGSVTFGDQLILRFHSSALAKKFLNATKAELEAEEKARAKAEKAAEKVAKPAKAEKPAKATKPKKVEAEEPEEAEEEPEEAEEEEGDEGDDEEGDDEGEEGDDEGEEEPEADDEEDLEAETKPKPKKAPKPEAVKPAKADKKTKKGAA